jgi:hypothetical protein
MYPSGRWRGYWEQVYWGRQAMEDLVLHFAGGRVSGRGWDVIGPFVFEGSYDDQGTVMLTKQYLGRHSVLYRGSYDGEGTILGTWHIGTSWSGPFALSPERRAMAEAPILDIRLGVP